MKRSEKFLFGTCMFFMGMVLGFLIAPMKNGIGNNCGNSVKNYYGLEACEEPKEEKIKK